MLSRHPPSIHARTHNMRSTRRQVLTHAGVVMAGAMAGTVMGAASCVHTRATKPTLEACVRALRAAAARRQRVEGLLQARLPGLQGAVLNADIDIVAMPAGFVFLSVRGFFGAPTHVLTSNGKDATLYDASGPAPVFRHGAVDDASLQRVLSIDIDPTRVVNVLLANVAQNDRTTHQLLRSDDVSTWVRVENSKDGSAVVVELDHSTLQPQHCAFFGGDGQPQFDVRYTWGAGSLPDGFRCSAPSTDGASSDERAIEFRWKEVKLNGPLRPPETFELVIPPGMKALPWRGR
jgi:hypothetical protein